jgi:hypothetical protein
MGMKRMRKITHKVFDLKKIVPAGEGIGDRQIKRENNSFRKILFAS